MRAKEAGSNSPASGQHLREAGLLGSMGNHGDGFDNALAESFFARLECELLARWRFPTRNAARLAVFECLEGFYNTHQRHSALGYLSPAADERRWTRSQQVAPLLADLQTGATPEPDAEPELANRCRLSPEMVRTGTGRHWAVPSCHPLRTRL
jgi:hypothetical protein